MPLDARSRRGESQDKKNKLELFSKVPMLHVIRKFKKEVDPC